MSDTTDSKSDVIPAYSEAGPEAESMERAAEGIRPAADDAVNSSEKAVPTDVPVENHGTTETDIPSRIAETARRKAAQMPH